MPAEVTYVLDPRVGPHNPPKSSYNKKLQVCKPERSSGEIVHKAVQKFGD